MTRREFLLATAAMAPLPCLPAPLSAQAPASGVPGAGRVEVLKSVRGVPPEIVGAFRDPVSFTQAASGQYFVFDRQGHTIYGIDAALTGAWKIVEVGGERGRILQPTGFSLAPNGTFVVADSPGERERIQLFGSGGALLGGFTLPGRAEGIITIGGVAMNGAGSLHYTGRTLLLSLPETGALIAEYSMSGTAIRTFGNLRTTGQESDRQVHLALNSGIPLQARDGGFYFVFHAGVPVFRKFDPSGRFLFERHIEGIELDETVNSLPTRWPRRVPSPGGELLPLVSPIVRTAAVDARGNLWLSFTGTAHNYVYDPAGDKARVVRLQAAGTLAPSGLFFSHTGRLLVAPGCYEFNPGRR